MNLNDFDNETSQQIEHTRRLWAAIAKDHGWYKEPFYVQVWVNEYGNITDSVACRGMTQDIVVASN